MSANGTIYPAVYVRRGGELEEHELDPHPVRAFDGDRTAATSSGSFGRC